MKEIKLKRIQIKNFFSVGDDPIEIEFHKGLHVITGINRDKEDSKNGVGKSALADAIFFAIFGVPLRAVKKENIPNWKTKKDCKVIVSFDVIDNFIKTEYVLMRSLFPSRIQLIQNGEDISRTIGKTTDMIGDIIGTSPEMFEQSVIMSLNQTEPFLAKKGATKRTFIEGIFKLTVFSEMLMIIRHDLNETKRLYDLEKAKIDEIENTLKVYNQQQKDQTESRTSRIKELEERYRKNTNEIEDLRERLTSIDNNLVKQIEEKLQTLKGKETEIRSKEKEHFQKSAVLQATVLSLKDSVNKINTLGAVCMTCKRPFSDADENHKKEEIAKYETEIDRLNQEIDEINKLVKEIEEKKNKCSQALEKLITEKHKIEIQKKENETTESRIKQCGIWNKQIQVDIEYIRNEQDTYITLITETITRIQTLNESLVGYKEKLSILDVAKFVVSEEGVKSFIVKKMLKMLNGRLNYYLKKLDANCICKFNEFFEETILNEKGEICSYFNFSGGERKRIDLAMLFTFIDIRRLQSNVSVNIVVYDELLDSSLDSKGIECVLEILTERVDHYGEAIYIISHKSEAIKHATGEVIYLEKYGEITRRLPYGSQIQTTS